MRCFSICFVLIGLILSSSCSSEQKSIEEDDFVENEENTKPNIVLIIADDMGLDASPGYDLGAVKPNMPNLQSMIDTGILFNNVWSNPTCTPTRGTILTGKYGSRTNILKVGDEISISETSLQKYIDDNTASAYSQAVIGKWHLSTSETNPNDMEIPYFAGFLRGAVTSYTDWDLLINGVTEPNTNYSTTELTDLAIDWVSDQTKPWFLWLAYNAPHTPFHLPPTNLHSQGDLPSDQASIDANPLPYYMAMLEAMDTEMGRFINSLSQYEKENTIFIFIGDNGAPMQVIQEYGRFKGKDTLYEGGINVPMVVSGYNVNRINTSDDALINATDLFATIASIAGVNISTVNDSFSFENLLNDANSSKREYIYSELSSTNGLSQTIRNSTHKLILFDDGSEALYDLENDPLENTNLLDSSPVNTLNESIKEELKNEMLSLGF